MERPPIPSRIDRLQVAAAIWPVSTAPSEKCSLAFTFFVTKVWKMRTHRQETRDKSIELYIDRYTFIGQRTTETVMIRTVISVHTY